MTLRVSRHQLRGENNTNQRHRSAHLIIRFQTICNFFAMMDIFCHTIVLSGCGHPDLRGRAVVGQCFHVYHDCWFLPQASSRFWLYEVLKIHCFPLAILGQRGSVERMVTFQINSTDTSTIE